MCFRQILEQLLLQLWPSLSSGRPSLPLQQLMSVGRRRREVSGDSRSFTILLSFGNSRLRALWVTEFLSQLPPRRVSHSFAKGIV